MTLFWLWTSAGCLASAIFGFSAVRYGARRLGTERPESAHAAVMSAAAPVGQRARPAATRTRKTAARRSAPAPVPTVPQPEAEKLVLWARQVKSGERTMSIATDGCRVTWNRVCKHGHPSWLVQLGYLRRLPPPKRHNPR
jgi:hypothetical protein